MHPPTSSAATQRSCDIDKVRFFRKIYILYSPSLQVPTAASPMTPVDESPVKPAEAKKSANKRSSCKVNSLD